MRTDEQLALLSIPTSQDPRSNVLTGDAYTPSVSAWRSKGISAFLPRK